MMEPEGGQAGEDVALARDGIGEDAVKGGNAVGSDQEEVVADLKDFADFAGGDFSDSREVQGVKEHEGGARG